MSTQTESKLTQAEFLKKSKFPVYVPEEPALRLSPTAFSEYITQLVNPELAKRDENSKPEAASIDSEKTEETSASTLVASESDHGQKRVASGNSFVDALAAEQGRKRRLTESDLRPNQMLTENRDVAYKDAGNPLVNLFHELEDVISSDRLSKLLSEAWDINPDATLRLIWNSRSIHLGKATRKTFYRCCGWLRENHPLTLLANLRWMTRPIILKKAPKKDEKKEGDEEDDFELVELDDMSLEDEGNPTRFDVENGVAHGYWKNLLNLLILEVNGALSVSADPSTVLNKQGEQKVRKREWDHDKAKEARDAKKKEWSDKVQQGFTKSEHSFYKALHLSVARLFGEQLQRDLNLLEEKKLRQLSLAAKWAPTLQGAHDKQSLIASTIAEYLFPRDDVLPKSADGDRELYLKHAREAYRMKVLSPLRKALEVVERDISATTFGNIKYERVPSLAMDRYSPLFIAKDTERFTKYIEAVAEGTKSISGATLLPSTIVSKARDDHSGMRTAKTAKQMIASKMSAVEQKVLDGQWKTLVQRIKDSGTLQSSIAVCDVSGSMMSPRFKDGTTPMDSSLGLSLLLAEVTQPPFGGYFITFSSQPEVQKVGGPDDKRSLHEKLGQMAMSTWTMNTDFVAVFEKLLLPMAIEAKVKPEDMVKQLFVFSDMQFDQAGGRNWANSFERIKAKFAEAGYEMPQMIFWNLAGGRSGYGNYYGFSGPGYEDAAPKPVTAEEPGVALVSGYSQGQLKMFLDNGQFDEPEEEETIEEKAEEDGDAMVVEKKQKKKMNPLTMVLKAISHRAYQMLKVVD